MICFQSSCFLLRITFDGIRTLKGHKEKRAALREDEKIAMPRGCGYEPDE